MRAQIIMAIIGLAGVATPAVADPRGEAEIAKAIDGRVAGTPVTCIYQRNIDTSRIISGTAILYEMRDRTIFINRPPAGATFLRRDLTLITDTHDGDRLCNVDIVRLYDTTSRVEMGSVGLGDFIPYAKPDK